MDVTITVEDVQGRIERPLTVDEVRVIPGWIEDARGVLVDGVPDVEARLALSPSAPAYLSGETVKRVLRRMVERKVRNPSGLRTFSVDGYDQTVDRENSAGKIYLSGDDLADLAPRPVESRRIPGAWSLQVST